MVRGRKPKPSREKALAGNPGERKLAANNPAPNDAEPVRPSDFSRLEAAIWDETAEELRALKLFKRADVGVIRGYVVNLAKAIQCEEAIRKGGMVVDTPHGPRRSPHTTLARESWQLVRSFASELGLSPANRTRLHVQPEDAGDKLLRWLDEQDAERTNTLQRRR